MIVCICHFYSTIYRLQRTVIKWCVTCM